MHTVTDERGELVEIFRFPHDGQVFCVKMPQGVVRGDHYHERKTEHFCVISGEATISVRERGQKQFNQYSVSGREPEVRTVRPGNVHNIEAVTDCTFLVWVDELFNADDPDTYPEAV
jgi:dTDP-4-dehydrorhamnose 3,5-epimerase-like enzyme